MQVDRSEASMISVRQRVKVRITDNGHPHNGCEGFVIKAELPPYSCYPMYHLQLTQCRHGSDACYVDSRDVEIIAEPGEE